WSSDVCSSYLTSGLAEYYETRFDPNHAGVPEEPNGIASQDRKARLDVLVDSLHERLEQVPTLDADRVLRQFLTVMQATDRTNVYIAQDQKSTRLNSSHVSNSYAVFCVNT